jgi:Cupredoxin-like domain
MEQARCASVTRSANAEPLRAARRLADTGAARGGWPTEAQASSELPATSPGMHALWAAAHLSFWLLWITSSALTLGACRRADPGATGSAAARRVGLSATGERRITITITADGFVPTSNYVTVGEHVTLVVTRMVEQTCAKDIVIEDYAILVPLPLGEPVQVQFTPTRPGRIRFAGCAINMVVGEIVAE